MQVTQELRCLFASLYIHYQGLSFMECLVPVSLIAARPAATAAATSEPEQPGRQGEGGEREGRREGWREKWSRRQGRWNEVSWILNSNQTNVWIIRCICTSYDSFFHAVTLCTLESDINAFVIHWKSRFVREWTRTAAAIFKFSLFLQQTILELFQVRLQQMK